MIQNPKPLTGTAPAENSTQRAVPSPAGDPTLQQIAERRTRALADALEEAIHRAVRTPAYARGRAAGKAS
ncbi:hypothetical protein ACKI2N_030385 [Cupriavidus sp. 30B13]|uniref:hypothetical protein n=1 Tax=Cupriavidus sp. 30B13 TaxID=3384241 RepID=UPI003B911889